MSKKGQACLEAIFTLAPTFLVLGFLGLAYFGFLLKSWVYHNSYEMAVCLQTYPNTAIECEARLLQQLKALWPLGLLDIKTTKHNSIIYVEGKYGFIAPWKISFKHHISVQ